MINKNLNVEAGLLRGSDRTWTVSKADSDYVCYGARIRLSVERCSGRTSAERCWQGWADECKRTQNKSATSTGSL